MEYPRPVRSIGFAVAVTALVAGPTGCSQPQPAGDEPEQQISDHEFQQRHRLIAPLENVDEERLGQQPPTLAEFWIDDQGRVQVNILPYLLDPGPEEPADTEAIDDPDQ